VKRRLFLFLLSSSPRVRRVGDGEDREGEVLLRPFFGETEE